MTFKTKFALATAILLWASAFVGIRAGLHGYSPEALALLRYLVASAFMALIYYFMPLKSTMRFTDICALMGVGAIGVGLYNLMLNHGEMYLASGMTSFITSQSPIITTCFAILFLGEQLTLGRVLGFLVSISGVALIAFGELGQLAWNDHISYVIFATLAGSCYTILQKPFMKRCHAIEATTYVVWGGTLFLAVYAPQLKQEIAHASLATTMTVIYLGVFPASIGYVAWSYVLTEIPASRAVSFLYFMPFGATILGWLLLGEVPMLFSVAGGVVAIMGVWMVNQSFQSPGLQVRRQALE